MRSPWGAGGETCEVWDWSSVSESGPNTQGADKGSDRIWKILSKPLVGTKVGTTGDVMERRNPLAFAHFANHPAKGMMPNVMVCPYDFPLTEKDMRIYVPNILFGSGDGIKMKRFGSFWFKSGGSSNGGSDVPILKSLVLVATRALCDEEVLLNYSLRLNIEMDEVLASVAETIKNFAMIYLVDITEEQTYHDQSWHRKQQ
ncbi:hypothetical protein F0562_023947 [Nyssa sinensis]|uniref:SET domain-containing protein n=1 Tax=Nyssa sinensis TaxID=561372 RepID=A0A5J5BI24_9ASTE|nr:hypothetical protein F0562_023947 [Nyssa sinensis]